MKKPDPELCEKCRYRGFLDSTDQLCCDYLWITGHARTALPPREDGLCPGFEAGAREGLEFNRNELPVEDQNKFVTQFDTETMERLYSEGATDLIIAQRCGCSKTTVRRWRRFRNLPPNILDKQPIYDREVMMALYRKGSSDKRIATIMGCTPPVVADWRHHNGLPPATEGGREFKYDRNEMRRLYDQGLVDSQIAAKLGCGATAVQRWRKKAGLIPNGKRRRT